LQGIYSLLIVEGLALILDAVSILSFYRQNQIGKQSLSKIYRSLAWYQAKGATVLAITK
jgi:hypothetical protein